ncbi:hypothetical protein DYBT9275_01275 [Dyadobacter sp. CECT 9275]|uniref:Uncharacterized protein n=1 Tax=Dyadobacter helix TaxID=2822344 RepID=A0A916JAY9_9BACT|nr:hypothetical protein DYBT9275_01275 [Dyadobacter sp. CECT 9275]
MYMGIKFQNHPVFSEWFFATSEYNQKLLVYINVLF